MRLALFIRIYNDLRIKLVVYYSGLCMMPNYMDCKAQETMMNKMINWTEELGGIGKQSREEI